MKMKKLFISIFAVMVILQIFSGNVFAASEEDTVASGTYKNITWKLNDAGLLTISGTGEMESMEWSEYPWQDCESFVTSIVIEEGVTAIGDGAFKCFSNLTSVRMYPGLVSIGNDVFSNCEQLVAVTIPDTVTSLGNRAFQFCSSLTEIVIPSNVTTIGNSVFSYCENLAEVEILSKVTVIKESTFSHCTSLSNITIPDTVTTIEYDAFSACESFTEIMIPASVTTIGNEAFAGCDGLINVIIPSGVESIGAGAFAYCDGLIKIVVDNENKNYSAEDGVLFNKDKTSILCYPDSKEDESYEIPLGIKTIAEMAFVSTNFLKYLTIPDSVTTVETASLTGPSIKTIKFKGEMPDFEADSFIRTSVTVYYPDTWENVPGENFKGADHIQWISYKVELDTPQLISVSNTSTGVTVKWAKVTGAEKYRVFRKSGSESWEKVGDATSTSYTDTKAKSGTTYTYTVRCLSNDGTTYTSSYDKTGKSIKYIAQPVLSSVANASNGITIKWAKVTGAAKYRVFRKSGSGSWTKVGDTTSTSYTDTTVKSGTTYTYTVRCISSNGKNYTSSYDKTGKSIKRLAQPAAAVKNSSKGITVSWKKITGASGYYVYRKASGESSYKMVKKITSGSTLSYTNTGLTNGKTYSYKVKAYSGSYVSATSSVKSYYRLSSPSISSLKNSASKKMTVKWGKNTKATGFEIQYGLKSSFSGASKVTVKSGSTVSKTIAKLTKGKKYYVRIRSYKTVSGKKYYSAWSGVKSVKISR